jgi:uncharacterized protein (TIGR03435 family)
MKTTACLLLMVCTAAASASVLAQTRSAPAFEVASVRLTSPGTRGSSRVTDTRVDLINYPLGALLRMAFRVSEYQLVTPDWVDSVRVDINATLPPGASRSQVPEMLQDLLRRRFGAETHVESRRMQAYELLVGPNGVSMREVPPLDELAAELPADAFSTPPVSETVDGPVRSFAIPLGMTMLTANTRYTILFTAERTRILDARRMTMNELATVLQSTMDAPVVNRTGLSGGYAFKIELPPDATSVRRMLSIGISATVKGTPLTEPTGVSAQDALKQIGLQLERRRTPIEVIVVDKLERTPTAN